MENNTLISICVPTFKREKIVREMLKSIYSQGVDNALFEVCITDNSETDETKNLIEEEFAGIENLHYKKVTCKGFLNSIEALKFGHGRFLKLHNDYSLFKEGALQRMIDYVDSHQTDRPMIFYSMNTLHNKSLLTEFDNFNDFLYNIHYFSTWSTSFAIWKEDFDKLIQSGIEVNYMYPHTTLLFALVNKQRYVVDDFEYVTNIEPEKKGGYNLVDNFVRIYLTMVREDLLRPDYITRKTYKKIEKGIIKFSAKWYATVKKNPNKYTFTFENDKRIVRKTCGAWTALKYACYKKYYVIA